MLTLFRRIRKGLLDGGRTSKYLLYAIGEILLVMIGILLALQVNNRNVWKKDRVKEKQVVKGMANTLETNLKQLEYHRDFMNRYDYVRANLSFLFLIRNN
jgi:hypothetical protein